MTKSEQEKKIHQLEQQVLLNKALYYQGKAKISDAQFDALEDELRRLAPDSAVLDVVGSALLSKDIAHDVPMLSLGKTRDPADILEWLLWQVRCERKSQAQASGADESSLPLTFEKALVSVKMDGSSASLIYRNGKFVQGKTRGDGYYGENITSQLSFVPFPKEFFLPGGIGDFEIRGEVCISRTKFANLCAAQKAKGLEEPKAIRNIVAGLLHTKLLPNNDQNKVDDGEAAIINCSYLDFIGYEIICDRLTITQEQEKFTILEKAGFIVPPHWPLLSESGFSEILKEYQNLDDNDFDFLSDGLVVAIDDLSRQKLRGITAHHPKGKMAFKFHAETATTRLKEIEISIGRTGKLSFVGIVDPVDLSGATVSRVTLHNASYIQAEHLGRGALIEICRSGEVIPKHERTLEAAPEDLILPENCPYCGTTLTSSETGIDLLCENTRCPGRLINNLRYFVSTVGIEFLGERSLQKLMNYGFLTTPADLWRLTAEKLQILKNGSTSDKMEQKILDSLEEHRRIPLNTFLTAVGIDGFGLNAVKLLTTQYPSQDKLQKLEAEDLEQITGLGKILSTNIINGLKDLAWPLLAELSAVGVTIGSQITNGPLKDKNIVITGSLEHGNRKQLEAKIEAAGGNFSNSVGRKTDYLVCNNPSNSTKFQRALSYGVKIISEAELYSLMGENLPAADTVEPENGPGNNGSKQLELY